MEQSRALRRKEGGLFLRRWLTAPRAMGSIWPSSRWLARAIASCVVAEADDTVVELGGGTGAITRGLLERGIAPERIVVVELDPDLVAFLRWRVPGCRVVAGDATRLRAILGELGVARVGSVVSGLPMLGMPEAFQRAIVEQGLGALRPGGTMLQYTYAVRPPVPTARLGIEAELARFVPLNLPPATVWRYRRRAG
jgi:phosphatidylethanolamine/phosphatidyl-N-methylethanolamine N-methyltransferase